MILIHFNITYILLIIYSINIIFIFSQFKWSLLFLFVI